MRKALCVGINRYDNMADLSACVTDAQKMANVLRRNGDTDNSVNFGIALETANVTKRRLRQQLERLFSTPAEIALLYFSGHGIVTSTGGCLMTQDAQSYDEGVGMDDVMKLANRSPATNKVIILDCCHAGAVGKDELASSESAVIGHGVSILGASRDTEVALETQQGGLFTSLVVAALRDTAADVLGNITLASVYSFVDQALGPFDQRPIFMTNVSSYIQIRKVRPKVPLKVIRRIAEYFRGPEEEFPLDPSYEEDHDAAVPEKVRVFKELQKLVSIGLVEPVGEDHMYYAAINHKSCRLTPKGRRYWQLAVNQRF